MDFLCKVCDPSIIEFQSEYKEYIATSRKENDKSLQKKLTINNINLDEVDKILNDYVTTHNKLFDFYFINCELVIEFNKNFTANIETNYLYIIDITNTKRYFLYDIYYFTSRV